jgi:nucleoside 2-deoxyribosyltransferase
MKIYFAGSVRAGRGDQDIYAQIIAALAKHGTVLTEHLGKASLTEDGEPIGDAAIYERDLAWVKEADAVVAEVTNPSLGVGYEIGVADGHKPVLCLYRPQEGKRLSAMLTGNKNVQVVEYHDLAEAEAAMATFFEKIASGR